MSQECKCETCSAGCKYRTGWFLPGEISKVAEYLELSEKELFDRYLGVDWYVDFDDIFVLAPANREMTPGTEYPANPVGECVFFEDGLCKVHPVKPFECKEFYHTDDKLTTMRRHERVAWEWKEYQDYVVGLLGEEPIAHLMHRRY